MPKPSKFKTLGNVGAVVAAAASYSEAARLLGVNQSTVSRWAKHGRVPRKTPVPVGDVHVPSARQTPEEWAESVRRERGVSASEEQLLERAVHMLTLARDGQQAASVRIQATARYQQLIRQLRLDVTPVDAAPLRSAAGGVRPMVDPRALLGRVK